MQMFNGNGFFFHSVWVCIFTTFDKQFKNVQLSAYLFILMQLSRYKLILYSENKDLSLFQ